MFNWIEQRRIRRAQEALRRRGICPIHGKPANIHKSNPESWGRGFNVLCEDCLRDWEAEQRDRVTELKRIVGLE